LAAENTKYFDYCREEEHMVAEKSNIFGCREEEHFGCRYEEFWRHKKGTFWLQSRGTFSLQRNRTFCSNGEKIILRVLKFFKIILCPSRHSF
jgi:hypothetical protein